MSGEKNGNVSLSDLDQEFPGWDDASGTCHTYELLSKTINIAKNYEGDIQGNIHIGSNQL